MVLLSLSDFPNVLAFNWKYKNKHNGDKIRASAQRITNTPGQRHFLIIKYFKVNENDIR